MGEGFTKLKELGAQKVSEETHISKQHVQALIDENFKVVQKVQFLGFVSIIERDYQIDLSELRTKALAHYEQNIATKPASVFIEKKSKKSSKGLYIFVVLIVFLLVSYFNIDTKTPTVDVNATQVESITQEIEALVESNMSESNLSAWDENLSDFSDKESEVNATIQEEVVATEPINAESLKTDSLKIIANEKIWFGYIELGSDEKKQTVLFDTFELDPSKSWLLRFGHSNIEIELKGKKLNFKKGKNVQFLYQEGALKQLSMEEFKTFNKGQAW
ncbi:MAG: hypothetical protein PHU40_06225 [Sulfurimonas sp.]|nr:hypothetical protein [Sulfurimonas sp.]